MCGSYFNSVWTRLPCYISKGLQKLDFLDIYLTTVFRARNFQKASAMTVIFFWKCSKFYLHFKNAERNWEKVFPLIDNCIWFGCVKFSLLRREYLSPAVNVLKNSLKILCITKRNFFEINCLHFDQWICWRGCGSDLNSVRTRLPCCFWKVLQKQDFLDIHLTTVFGVHNSENTSAMRVIFIWKSSKFYLHFQNEEKNSEKAFSFRDNCIWIGWVKLSVLRREYLWQEVKKHS